jgi:hypothetical protein
MNRVLLNLTFLACMFATLPVHAGMDVLVPYETLESGVNSGAVQDKPVLHQIKDEKSWEAFWAQHLTITPKSKPKSVDFSRKQVIAIVDSDQPNSGYHLRLDRIEEHNGELLVYVTREQPAPECLNLGMVAQPYVIVTINQFSGPAKLIFNTRMRGCSK